MLHTRHFGRPTSVSPSAVLLNS